MKFHSLQLVGLCFLFASFVDAHLRSEERRLSHTTLDFADFKSGAKLTALGHGIQIKTLTRHVNRYDEFMVPASAIVTESNHHIGSNNVLVISEEDDTSQGSVGSKTGGQFVMDFEEQLVLKSINLVNSKGTLI